MWRVIGSSVILNRTCPHRRLCRAAHISARERQGVSRRCVPIQSPRSAGINGARNVARTAIMPAASPTTSTTPSVIKSSSHGTAALPAKSWDAIAMIAASTPAPSPASNSAAFSHITIAARSAAAETGGPQQRQFAATLENAPQLHDGQPDRSEQQSQAAEALERRKIRVLNGHERRQKVGRRLGVEAVIVQAGFQSVAHSAGGRLIARVDEEKAIAARAGKYRSSADSDISTSPWNKLFCNSPTTISDTFWPSAAVMSNVLPTPSRCRP